MLSQSKMEMPELIRKLYNNRVALKEWFQSEVGSLVVQYLSSNSEEALNQIKTKDVSGYSLGLYQGQIQGVEWFLELETELENYRVAEEAEAERQASFKLDSLMDTYQAISEGKTGWQTKQGIDNVKFGGR